MQSKGIGEKSTWLHIISPEKYVYAKNVDFQENFQPNFSK